MSRRGMIGADDGPAVIQLQNSPCAFVDHGLQRQDHTGLQAYAVTGTSEQAVEAALRHETEIYDDETLEARQIKSMVLGMKDELRRFRAAGGSIAAYGRRLAKRQQEEMRYYFLAKRELEMAQKSHMPAREFDTLWEKRNDQLRNLGIKLIPLED